MKFFNGPFGGLLLGLSTAVFVSACVPVAQTQNLFCWTDVNSGTMNCTPILSRPVQQPMTGSGDKTHPPHQLSHARLPGQVRGVSEHKHIGQSTAAASTDGVSVKSGWGASGGAAAASDAGAVATGSGSAAAASSAGVAASSGTSGTTAGSDRATPGGFGSAAAASSAGAATSSGGSSAAASSAGVSVSSGGSSAAASSAGVAVSN